MTLLHKNLASGGWSNLSLLEQLGNIGSEISRAHTWREKDEIVFRNTIERALELFDLTLADPRWKERSREIKRAREVFCDAVSGGIKYGSTLSDVERYFFHFALAARRKPPVKAPNPQNVNKHTKQ